jgi:flavin reductase (DIM6/NTAB) family NADH-FMN oxidoreductase RutF
MRQLAAGVTLITSEHGGRRSGLTATAVCSVSAEPPQLLVCINQLAETYDTVRRSRSFAVNLLASDQQQLAEIFAGTGGIFGDQRFDQAQWTTLATGAPVLGTCVASFDCSLVQCVPASTHSIFIGQVEAVRLEPDLEPLVYVEGDYGLIAPRMTPAT